MHYHVIKQFFGPYKLLSDLGREDTRNFRAMTDKLPKHSGNQYTTRGLPLLGAIKVAEQTDLPKLATKTKNAYHLEPCNLAEIRAVDEGPGSPAAGKRRAIVGGCGGHETTFTERACAGADHRG